MKKKYIYILCVLGTLLALSILLAILYGIWLSKNNNNNLSYDKSGCVSIIYSDNKKITLKNLKGMKDEEGMIGTPNTITVTNNCKDIQNVELDLDVLEKSTVDDSKMHIYVNGEHELGPSILSKLRYNKGSDNVSRVYQLITFTMKPNDTKRINLRLWLDENVPPQDNNNFYAEYYIQTGDNNIVATFKETLLKKFKTIDTNVDYSSVSSDENVFIKVDDDYYLRGNNELNYVKFANHTWRIMGITSNDDIKLLYADGDLSSKYNELSNVEEQLGYQDSVLYKYLNEWYDNNLKEYDDLIEEYKYCSDSSYTMERRLEFGGYTRVFNDNSPSIKCESSDKDYGGVIESKIGLITLDEANIIGGTSKENNNSYYIYDGKEYFTMSPAFMGSQAWVGTVSQSGKIDASQVNIAREIRPVIILSNYATFTGSGSFEDPYVIN